MYQDYADRGFFVITVFSGGTQEQVAAWADQYGLSFPVLYDPSGQIPARFERDYAIPTQNLVGPGMELLVVDEFVDNTQIEDSLPQ